MGDTAKSLEEELKDLWTSYAEQLPQRVDQIERLWNSWQDDQGNLEHLKTMRRLVHGLAGSGTMFGFAAVSDAARSLEQCLDSILENPHPASADRVTSLLLKLTRVASESASPDLDL